MNRNQTYVTNLICLHKEGFCSWQNTWTDTPGEMFLDYKTIMHLLTKLKFAENTTEVVSFGKLNRVDWTLRHGKDDDVGPVTRGGCRRRERHAHRARPYTAVIRREVVPSTCWVNISFLWNC